MIATTVVRKFCNVLYVGQTFRPYESRFKEHNTQPTPKQDTLQRRTKETIPAPKLLRLLWGGRDHPGHILSAQTIRLTIKDQLFVRESFSSQVSLSLVGIAWNGKTELVINDKCDGVDLHTSIGAAPCPFYQPNFRWTAKPHLAE